MLLLKRSICAIFSGMFLCSCCLCIPVKAAEISSPPAYFAINRATGHFDTEIPPDSTMSVDEPKLSMESGETIGIRATYSPTSASVDFGIIDSDGTFFSVNADDGDIDIKMEVPKRGDYQFAIRNNSSNTITVSGFVDY